MTADKKYLTSKQAIKLFINAGLSESTFRNRVKEKDIDSFLPEGRQRGALYPEDQVRAIIKDEKKEPQFEVIHGETDWVKESDLVHLLALDIEVYGIENAVDILITHTWWKKNTTGCRIIFNPNDRKDIWGAISVIPMKEETITRILKGEMTEREIVAEDVLTYEKGKSYSAYIPSAIIRPDHRQSLPKLINSFLDFLSSLYPDTQVKRLYAFAFSDEGLKLIKYLFFSPRYDLGEDVFELDPFRKNPSPFIKKFQESIAMKEAS